MALLKLDHLKNKYDLEISKIAHIGAHKGQEVEEYLNIFPKVMRRTMMQNGIDEIFWAELSRTPLI